jgi:hypothetical protein
MIKGISWELAIFWALALSKPNNVPSLSAEFNNNSLPLLVEISETLCCNAFAEITPFE